MGGEPMMNTLDILIAARKLLDEPGKWVKGVEAIDEHGLLVDAGHPGAQRFCAIGAIRHVTFRQPVESDTDWNDLDTAASKAIVALELPVRFGSAVHLNDSPRTTHADVLDVFDQTIRVLKQIADAIYPCAGR
jgi:hypothetical protein